MESPPAEASTTRTGQGPAHFTGNSWSNLATKAASEAYIGLRAASFDGLGHETASGVEVSIDRLCALYRGVEIGDFHRCAQRSGGIG